MAVDPACKLTGLVLVFSAASGQLRTSLVAQMVKVSAYNVGELCLIPGLGRSPGEENGNPLLYSCLENPMDKGALQVTVL